jgi:hypothetical protein
MDMSGWISTYNRLWEIVGDEAVPRNNVELIGVSITGDGAEVTLGGPLPCTELTEFQSGNTWVVTRNEESVKYNEDDIILQLNGCEFAEMHIGSMTDIRVSEAHQTMVVVKVRCERVWIK